MIAPYPKAMNCSEVLNRVVLGKWHTLKVKTQELLTFHTNPEHNLPTGLPSLIHETLITLIWAGSDCLYSLDHVS